jgi:uncharacterized protein
MLSLELLAECYAICRLPPDSPVPNWAVERDENLSQFVSLTWTPDELSIVCPESIVPEDVESEQGWVCMRVAGKLDFSLVGVLSGITSHLAVADISVFAVSTFDTDYLLLKSSHLPLAAKTLSEAGYTVYPWGGA